MARLAIGLLGPFRATLVGKPVTHFETEKARALLAYLAAEAEQPHPRESLAEMLWPDRPEGAARANLRHALGNLRTLLGEPPLSQGLQAAPPFLLVTRETIQLNPEADSWVDTTAFLRLVRGTNPNPQPPIDCLEEAVKLYRGPFLDDISVGDSAPFQEWVLLKREQFQRQVIMVLNRLARSYEILGQYDRALGHAWRQAELAPWDEGAHQQVMRLLAFAGQPGAALAHYETCRHLLEKELGVEPGAETIQLYEQIRDGQLERPAHRPDFHLPGFLKEDAGSVAPSVFVAREPELAKLGSLLKEMLEGQAGLAFIVGDAGQGKTALMNAFARSAMETYPELLVAGGNCNSFSGAGDPYRPFRDIMAMLTGDVETRWRAGSITRDHARRLWGAQALAVQAVAAGGGALIGPILSGDALLSRAASANPGQVDWLERLEPLTQRKWTGGAELEQSQLLEQCTNVLRALSGRHPLVLLLDDMQWADNSSISLLFHLGRRLGESRVLIVCAYRPEEVALARGGERHPLAKALAELKLIWGDVWVDLNQTDKAEGRRFVDALLDAQPNRLTEAFRATLFGRGQGHPLFTVELLRSMRARGDLLKDSGGVWIESPRLDWTLLPARVDAVIEERIGRLEPELQHILSIAAVEGEIFTAQVVTEVYQRAELPLLGRLSQELYRQHRLVREYDEVTTARGPLARYQFSHVLFRDHLYGRLSQGERRRLHLEVAAAIEKLFEGQLDEMAAQLAQHFFQAGDHDRAFQYCSQAADRAARSFANAEAVSHYTRAIELAPPASPGSAALAQLYRGRGLANDMLGEFDRSRADLETARQVAHAAGENQLECQALLDLGRLWTSRDYHQFRRYSELALELARQIDEPAMLAHSLEMMGTWYSRGAENPLKAIECYQKALEIFEEIRDRRALANTLELLGIASQRGCNFADSLKYYDQAIALFRELGDRPNLVSNLLNRGDLCEKSYSSILAVPTYGPGDGRRDFEEALQIAREIGWRRAEVYVLVDLGSMLVDQGDFGLALDTIQNGLRIASEIEDRECLVGCHSMLGYAYLELFAPQEALPYFEAALALAHELQAQFWINQVTGTVAAAHVLLGDLPQAQACLETVLSPETPMDTMQRRYCWSRRAALALCQSDPALALDIADRLIASAPGLSPGQVITLPWKLKGEALAALGNTGEAERLLRDALENALVCGEQVMVWRLLASLGQLYRTLGREKESQAEFASAGRIIDDQAATVPDQALRDNYLRAAHTAIRGYS